MILPDFFKSYSPTPSSHKKTADEIGGLFCYVHPSQGQVSHINLQYIKPKSRVKKQNSLFFQIYPVIILTFGLRKRYT